MCFGGPTLLPRAVTIAYAYRILLGQVLSSLTRRGQNRSFAPRDRICLLGSWCLFSLYTVSLLPSACATIGWNRCKLTGNEGHLSWMVMLVGEHRRNFCPITARFLTLCFLLCIRIIYVKVWDEGRLAILVHGRSNWLLILVGWVLILGVSLARCVLSSLIPIIASGLELNNSLFEDFFFSDQFLHFKIRIMACEILHDLETLSQILILILQLVYFLILFIDQLRLLLDRLPQTEIPLQHLLHHVDCLNYASCYRVLGLIRCIVHAVAWTT